MFLHLFPKALGIRTPVLPGNQVNYVVVVSRGGLGFRTLVRNLSLPMLLCMILNGNSSTSSSIPFSPIEIVC